MLGIEVTKLVMIMFIRYVNALYSSHLEGSSTSVGRPGYCHCPVSAVTYVNARQPILLDTSSDGVHAS